MTALINNGAALLQPLVEKSGLSLCISDDVSNLPELEGDGAKLGAAINGILHNAVKFTPKGGTISVSVQRTQSGVRIAIEDTGIGMEPECIDAVVRPFHRLRSALDGQHQGAGLGLPYAKAIVDQHHGSLTIYSWPGEGTRVEILLPLASHALSDAA